MKHERRAGGGRKGDDKGRRLADEALDDELLDEGEDDDEEDELPSPEAARTAPQPRPPEAARTAPQPRPPAIEEEPEPAAPDADEAEAERFASRVQAEAGEAHEKPALLRAVEKLLADPEVLKADVEALRVRTRRRTGKSGPELDRALADALVTSYSRRTMLVGGAAALAGVVPGLGSVVGMFGAAIADAALSMKYEIELVLAIATAFGRDVSIERERDACILVAGLGTLAEVGKFSGRQLTRRAFVALVRRLLGGDVGRWLVLVFRLLGLKLAPKAFAAAIPLGIGVVLNVVANRAVTRIVGGRAIEWFAPADA